MRPKSGIFISKEYNIKKSPSEEELFVLVVDREGFEPSYSLEGRFTVSSI